MANDLRVRLAPQAELPRSSLEDILRAQLARADTLWRELLGGARRVY
jgi:hypothetical protein